MKYKIDDPEFHKYLSNLGVLSLDAKTNTYKPTGLGILLFGVEPRSIYKQAGLNTVIDYGSNKIEATSFDQPLVLIPDLVEQWLKKVLLLSRDTTSFKRKEVPDFPIEVLREAVMNALVHRDYTIEGVKSSIEIDNDKIVIKSPGAPVSSITLDQLNTFKAPSISRNPIITYVFNLMGYVEETGLGMRSMKSLNEKFGLPLPEYSFEPPFLVLTFPRNLEAVKRVTHNPSIEKLTTEELEGYEWIKSKEKVTRKEYEDNFKFDKKKAERQLTKLADLQLIKKTGAGPSTRYEIIAT